MDTYILDDLDGFDPDSIYDDTDIDDNGTNDDLDDINEDIDENVYIDEASIIIL